MAASRCKTRSGKRTNIGAATPGVTLALVDEDDVTTVVLEGEMLVPLKSTDGV